MNAQRVSFEIYFPRNGNKSARAPHSRRNRSRTEGSNELPSTRYRSNTQASNELNVKKSVPTFYNTKKDEEVQLNQTCLGSNAKHNRQRANTVSSISSEPLKRKTLRRIEQASRTKSWDADLCLINDDKIAIYSDHRSCDDLHATELDSSNILACERKLLQKRFSRQAFNESRVSYCPSYEAKSSYIRNQGRQ